MRSDRPRDRIRVALAELGRVLLCSALRFTETVATTPMNAVFVSYRRGDSAGWTGRLVAGLRQQFPTTKIFMDIQEIRAGRDFREAIDDALASSRVVLAV